MEPKCKTCKHFVAHPTKQNEGQCRREPPKLFMMVMEHIAGNPKPVFVNQVPGVGPDFWCGEYVSKIN